MAKKSKHIDLKDYGDAITKNVAVYYEETVDKITQLSNKTLLKDLSKTPKEWKSSQTMELKSFKKQTSLILGQAYQKISNTLNDINSDIMNENQVKATLKGIKKDLNGLNKTAIKKHNSNVNSVYQKVIHSNVPDALYQMASSTVVNNAKDGIKQYSNGKNYQWESYMEMKMRTEIQADISENLVQANHDIGVIFYTTSFYGNCAPDHADYQGKIYYDKDWESNVSDAALKEKIKAYIKPLKSIQEIKDSEPWLTTRPNCRHYFQPLPTDEVLGCSSDDDVKKLRDQYNLNFLGSYKPEKYEALQKQRYLERQIRSKKAMYKAQKGAVEELKKDNPIDSTIVVKETALLNKYKRYKDNYERKQRQHISDNPELVRSYQRENYHSLNVSAKEKVEERIASYSNNKNYIINETKNDNVVKIEKWPTESEFLKNGMSKEQIDAFKVYTENTEKKETSCPIINRLLWSSGGKSLMSKKQIDAYNYLHEGIVNSKYIAKKDEILYKGTGYSLQQLINYGYLSNEKNTVINSKGFFSTTNNIETALYYANNNYSDRNKAVDNSPQVIFRIACNNTKYIPLEGITRTKKDYETLIMDNVNIVCKNKLDDVSLEKIEKQFIIIDVEVQ